MHHVSMAKLSTQLLADQPTERPTRSSRVRSFQADERERKKIEAYNQGLKNAKVKLDNANLENYEQIYNSLDQEYSKNFMSPSALKQTSEYKKFEVAKEKQAEVQSWKGAFNDYNQYRRGKPFFLGLNPSSETKRKFREVQKAMAGDPSTIPQHVVSTLRAGLTTSFSATPQVYGLDLGEVRKQTTKDTATGEIRKEVVISKTLDPKTRRAIISKATTTFKSSVEMDAERKAQYQDFLKDLPKVEFEDPTPPDDQRWYKKVLDVGENIFVQPFREVKTKGVITALYVDPTKKLIGYGKDVGSAGIGYTIEKASPVRNYLRENVHYDIGGTASMPKLNLKFGKVEEDVFQEAGVTAQETLNAKAMKVLQGEITAQLGLDQYTEFKASKEEQGKSEITSLFYRSDLGKQAFFDAKTEQEVTDAFNVYSKTDEFKQYGSKYQKEYQADLDKLLFDVPYLKKIKGAGAGLKIVGLGLGGSVAKVITSPTDTAIVGGAIYGAGALYGTMSASSLLALDVGFGTYGASKLFDPKSSISERGSGALMLGVSTISLGAKGVSYLRRPTIKFKTIKPPKMDLRATQSIGKDLKNMNRVVFKNQKLSQVGVAGRRTIITTNFRKLLGLKPIYRGVPTAQKGTTYLYRSFGKTSTFTSQSGYQKAFKLLTKRGGYSSYQATQTLKYIQPKVIETYLKSGFIQIKGTKAFGQQVHLTKQPVIKMSKYYENLGIKTRGARTIKTIDTFERKLITIKGKQFALQNLEKVELFLKRGSSPLALKDYQLSRSILSGKASNVKQGYDLLKTDLGKIKVFENIKYKDVYGISAGKTIFPSDKILRVEISNTRLIQKIVNLQKKNYGMKFIGGKKTPFSTTFGKVDNIKDIIKNSGGASQTNVNQIMKQIDQVSKQASKSTSQFYGKGMYERSDGGTLSPQMSDVFKQSVASPQIDVIPNIKQFINYGVVTKPLVKTSLLSGVISSSLLKPQLKLDAGLKMDFKMANLLKNEIKLKQPTATSLKGSLVSKQVSDLISGVTTTPPRYTSFKSTPIFQPKMPKIPTIPIFLPSKKGGKGRKKDLMKQIQDLAYLPDFTARAIGLKPETISEKQARKKLKQLLTGLEIRKGIIIK